MGETERSTPTRPPNVADGVPDRATNRPWWKPVLVGVAFLAWLAALAALYRAGRP